MRFAALLLFLAASVNDAGAQQSPNCATLDELPPGLYVTNHSGKIFIEQNELRLELGPGESGFAGLDGLTCLDNRPAMLDWPCGTDAARSRLFSTYRLEELAIDRILDQVVEYYMKVSEVLAPQPPWRDGGHTLLLDRDEIDRFRSRGYWYLPHSSTSLRNDGRPRTLLISLFNRTKQVIPDGAMLDVLGDDPDVLVSFVFNEPDVVPISHFGNEPSLKKIQKAFFERGMRAAEVPMWWKGDHHLKVTLSEFERFFDIPQLDEISADRQEALRRDLESDGFSRKPIMVTLLEPGGHMAVDQPERIRVAAEAGFDDIPVVLNYILPDGHLAVCGHGTSQGPSAGTVSGSRSPGQRRRPWGDHRWVPGTRPSGASGASGVSPPPRKRENAFPERQVEVFYGTDRERDDVSEANTFYGGGRGELELGIATVTIPLDHRLGELESPSFFKLEFQEDTEKHVVLGSVEPLNEGEFVEKLRKRVKQSESKSAFVFIHGYNVTFMDAARRAGQMAYDLQFTGAPMLYSWPSKGTPAGYTADEAVQDRSSYFLAEFLTLVRNQSGADTVHLIAHSMGNRALTSALTHMASPDGGPRFNQIALVAPDLDAEVFRDRIVPRILPMSERITLYASQGDNALEASAVVHDANRAGDLDGELILAEGIDIIDVTGLDASLLGHSYFAEVDSVIADIYRLLKGDSPPSSRSGLVRMEHEGVVYWRFAPVQ